MRAAASTAVVAVLLALGAVAPCRAETLEDIQKRFNDEVMGQPFSVKEQAELDAYIEEATRKGVVPREYTGTHWRQGATCEDLRTHSWEEYRDCMYYYRYYGRYYPWP